MADIPVNASDAEITVVVTTNGQTAFDFDFLTYDPDTMFAAHVTLAGVRTELVEGTDFTVTGVGQAGGGTITLMGGAPVTVIGESLIIYRSTIIERIADYQKAGDFRAATVNLEMDTVFMILQEIDRDVKGGLSGPVGSGISLPSPEEFTVLGWQNGQLENLDPTEFVNAAGIASAEQGRKADAIYDYAPTNLGFDCEADAIADDTAELLAALNYGILTGLPIRLHGRTRITSDITLTGTGASRLVVIADKNSEIIADGASKIIIAGTFDRVDFSGFALTDFSYSTFWLADYANVETFRMDNLKISGTTIALSAQGDPTAPNYTATRYYIPNADTRIGYLEISGCEIFDGVAGVYLPIVVEGSDIYKNHVHDLSNSLNVGSDLDRRVTAFTIGPLGGVVGGDFGAVGTNYSPDYDLIKKISIRDNRIERLTQNIVTKGVNSIAINGQNCIVTGNRISDQLSPGGVDVGDGNNNDNEVIYTKAKNTIVALNTMKNAGSSECCINIKSWSRAITDFTGLVDQPGYGNLVIGNIVEWDIAPADKTVFCTIHAGPATIVGNRALGLTGSCAILIQGIVAPYVLNEYPIIIDNNYFEGSHGAMVIMRGGCEALTIGPGNINNIVGGNGNCAYLDMSQARGQNYKNITVAGKHKVRNRTGATAYNAIVRAESSLYPINNLIVEGVVADHFDASNTSSVYKGLWLQTVTQPVRGLIWRDNVMPDGLFGQQVFDVANGDVEWSFDADMTFTTLGAAPTQTIFNARCPDDSAVVIEVDAVAFDAIGTAGTCDAAAYHKKGVYKREAAGNLAVVGAAVTILEAESDPTWACAPSVNVLFAVVSVTGDATNATRWKASVKSRIAKSA